MEHINNFLFTPILHFTPGVMWSVQQHHYVKRPAEVKAVTPLESILLQGIKTQSSQTDSDCDIQSVRGEDPAHHHPSTHQKREQTNAMLTLALVSFLSHHSSNVAKATFSTILRFRSLCMMFFISWIRVARTICTVAS